MMNFKNEEAVSPVIGVILMVAITVILAAVIAAFVFGMADTADAKPRNVAATAQISGKYLVVTYQGGPDHGEVKSVTCSAEVPDADGAAEGTLIGEDVAVQGFVSPPEVGHKWSAELLEDYGGKVVVVTVSAEFKDGTEKVILDKNLRVPGVPGEDPEETGDE